MEVPADVDGSQPTGQPYDGLLLDHDGVIVTLGDESALGDAARNALRDAGVDDPDPAVVETLRIWVSESDLTDVSRRYDLDPDRLWRYRDDHVRDELLAQVRDGGKRPYDDVAVLGDVNRPVGVVSNNQTRIVETVLEYYDLSHHVETIRARAPRRESLGRKKPRPTFLEEAMADLGLENPLYVGDSESDVEAGKRAGVDVAYIRRDHNTEVTLKCDPAYEVTGLDEVLDVFRDGHIDEQVGSGPSECADATATPDSDR